MNTVDDNLPNKEQDQNDAVRQDPKAVPDTALVELGKVSDTRGGFFGAKFDPGAGFVYY